MGKLLQLIAKLFGKNAISKTLGTRTNVIKLPSNEKKRLIKDELNIEAASDLAAQKVLKEAEDLIADIPKMNDQEVLTFTGNLQRLDNKINPPSAEVLDITTKKPVTGEGLEQLAARDGLPADVSPDSPIGRVMQGAQRLRKEKDELEKMLKESPLKAFEEGVLNNPYRSGGPLDPKVGIVRTAARQILRKKLDAGEIDIPDATERDAIAKGYQGGVDPIEVFRKRFGEDALQDLDEIADQLNRAGDFKEIDNILNKNKLFDIKPKAKYEPDPGAMSDEEMAALLKKSEDETPDEFATGGRVGFDDGGILSLEEAKKLNPGMFVDTTTYNPIPENAPNMAADEIAKVILGTGFLREEDDELDYPEGMEKPMSSKLFIFEEYVIPQRKKMMENFGLTLKEADDLIRQEMEKYRTNKATGGRVGFQIGGPAYDATDPIYGSSAITVTPDTIMGPQGNQIQAQMGKPSMTSQFFSGPAFDKYSAERTRAYTQSPSRLQYNLDANKAAGQFIQDRSKEMFGDNFLGKGLGILGTAASVPLAAAISPFHEAAQVIAEGRMEPGSGAKGFYDAFMAEKPFLTAAQRAGGVLQSIPVVGDAVTKAGEGIYDLLNKPTTAEPSAMPQGSPGQLNPTMADVAGPSEVERFKKAYDEAVYGMPSEEVNWYGTGRPNYDKLLAQYKNWNMSDPYFSDPETASKFKSLYGKSSGYNLASGGRVGYAYGSGLKLIQILQKLGKNLKTEIKKAVDDLIPSGDPKLDADMAVDNMLEDLNIDRDAIDQYDVLDAYGLAYDELKRPLLKEIEKTKSLAPKMIERFELKEKYPGIDDKLLTQIIDDPDPQRKAEVLATIDQAFELMRQGKSQEEVLDIMKQMTDRTKQAGGGLSYLSGF